MSSQDNDLVGPYLVVIGAVWASATLGAMVHDWPGWAKGAMCGLSLVLMAWGIARIELKARRRRLEESAEALRREQAILQAEKAEFAAEKAEQPED